MRDDVGEALVESTLRRNQTMPVEQQILHRGVEIELHLAGDPVVERVDLGVERGHAIAVAHGGEGRGDCGGRGAGLVGDAHDQRRPAAIDHRIGELRRDDFAAQPMMLERVGIPFGDFRGK